MSKTTSWHPKYVLTSNCLPWHQKVRHDVKKLKTLHIVYVMSNFFTSWHVFVTLTNFFMAWRIRHVKLFEIMTCFYVMKCFWCHDVFLMSWRCFWFHDGVFASMTWQPFWHHGELFDVMTHFLMYFWHHNKLFMSWQIFLWRTLYFVCLLRD